MRVWVDLSDCVFFVVVEFPAHESHTGLFPCDIAFSVTPRKQIMRHVAYFSWEKLPSVVVALICVFDDRMFDGTRKQVQLPRGRRSTLVEPGYPRCSCDIFGISLCTLDVLVVLFGELIN